MFEEILKNVSMKWGEVVRGVFIYTTKMQFTKSFGIFFCKIII